jgi:hypothetical protein
MTPKPYSDLQNYREHINFFDIYEQFWHASSERFASPGLGCRLDDLEVRVRFLTAVKYFSHLCSTHTHFKASYSEAGPFTFS